VELLVVRVSWLPKTAVAAAVVAAAWPAVAVVSLVVTIHQVQVQSHVKPRVFLLVVVMRAPVPQASAFHWPQFLQFRVRVAMW